VDLHLPAVHTDDAQSQSRKAEQAMNVYVVTVEQHYASYVRVLGVFSTHEKAELYVADKRVPDTRIYETEVDSYDQHMD
jgi:hypothetical protein